jgi:NAD-dependent histone deacetylase SIR2
MTKALYGQCADAQPTAFHHMLAKLAEEKHLLCLYTQSINGIETLLPPLSTQIPLQEPWPRTVQIHGSILKMGCTTCRAVLVLNTESMERIIKGLAGS